MPNDLLDELHAFFMGLLAGHEELRSAATVEFDRARAALAADASAPEPRHEVVVERLDRPGNRANLDAPCEFVPANEPWSCSTHPAGYRTALDQTECSIVLGEGTLAELGRAIREYGDYRAKVARAVLSKRAEHEHYWVDAPDDETGWHCTICGLTEYPGAVALDAAVRLFAEGLIAEIGSMASVQSWSKVETEARRSAYSDVLAVISDRLASPETPEAGTDVERLARAMHRVQGRGSHGEDCSSHRALARAVAAEYVRLSEEARETPEDGL